MGQPTEREKKILYIKSNLDKYIEELKHATGLHIAIRSMLINGEEQCQTINTTMSGIILDSVYAITGIHPDDIKRKTRKKEYVEARYIAMKLLRDHTNLTFEVIGLLLGKDHSSVSVGIEKYSIFYETDNHFRNKALDIISNLKESLKILNKDPEEACQK